MAKYLTGFSLGAVLSFVCGVIQRIYGGMTRSVVFVGPDKLCEIPWMRYTIMAIAVGVIFGICFNEMEKVERKKGKKISAIPRMKFKNFSTAILFFTTLFFSFFFIFVIREYNEYAAQVTYMFQRTFMQYCATNIPWLEILATSLIFGIILTMGFSSTTDEKSLKDKEVE